MAQLSIAKEHFPQKQELTMIGFILIIVQQINSIKIRIIITIYS